MDREISVHLNAGLFRLAFLYRIKSIIIGFAFPILGAAAILLHLITSGPLIPRDYFGKIMPIVLILLWCWFIFYNLYHKNMVMIQKMKEPLIKYRFTDEWFYVNSELGSEQNPWNVIKRIQKDTKLWRLIYGSEKAYVIPTELLDDELKYFLTEKVLKENGGVKGGYMRLAFFLFVFAVCMYLLMRHSP